MEGNRFSKRSTCLEGVGGCGQQLHPPNGTGCKFNYNTLPLTLLFTSLLLSPPHSPSFGFGDLFKVVERYSAGFCSNENSIYYSTCVLAPQLQLCSKIYYIIKLNFQTEVRILLLDAYQGKTSSVQWLLIICYGCVCVFLNKIK